MPVRIKSTLVAVAVVAAGLLARAEEKSASASLQKFEAIKKLAGDWVQVSKDGKPSDKVLSSFRVTAAGTAVEETIFPGTDHEMVTMYHLDGDDLVLTHYCSLGNQPHLRAVPSADANQIAFKFVSGTNLKSENDPHIHQATFTLESSDRFKAEWVACKDGKACHQESFDLVRKAK